MDICKNLTNSSRHDNGTGAWQTGWRWNHSVHKTIHALQTQVKLFLNSLENMNGKTPYKFFNPTLVLPWSHKAYISTKKAFHLESLDCHWVPLGNLHIFPLERWPTWCCLDRHLHTVIPMLLTHPAGWPLDALHSHSNRCVRRLGSHGLVLWKNNTNIYCTITGIILYKMWRLQALFLLQNSTLVSFKYSTVLYILYE